MRRRLLALALSLMALTVLAPSAGADALVDAEEEGPYVCVRSKLILGDPICVELFPHS